MDTSTNAYRRIRTLKMSVGILAGAICLATAACTSTPPGPPEVVVLPTSVPTSVPTAVPTQVPPPPTTVPTALPTVTVPVATVVPPTSTPVPAPTSPPRPTATAVPTVAPLPEAAIPVSISIPRFHSSAEIVPLGLTADGSMDAPSDPDTIGWYDLSAKVGRPGNAVVVGHVDWGGRLRAFGLLRELRAGDQVTVLDELDRELTYSVQTVETVKADAPPDGYLTQNGPEEQLTLITCGGEFDHSSHQYLSRVIVRAVRDTDAPVGAGQGGS